MDTVTAVNPTTLENPPTLALRQNPGNLELSFEARSGGVLVLYCDGKLVQRHENQADGAPGIATIVTEVLPIVRRMVVDLSGIKAVDYAGLGELVMIHLWAEAAGFNLKFASPSSAVLALFEAANVVWLFDLYVSLPEALAAAYREEEVRPA